LKIISQPFEFLSATTRKETEKMSENLNNGVVIRKLREIEGLSVQQFAKRIGKSRGWVSEVEGGVGRCRASDEEVNRIVELLGASKHRPMFRTWVANHKNAERVDRGFEGAILKFVRVKRGLRLEDVATEAGVSPCFLSKIENGHKPPPLAVRNRVLIACGYSPGSFKNLSTDPVRSKAVPNSYKLNILLKKLSEPQITEIFDLAKRLIEGVTWPDEIGPV
jgi:transcriptional regulator with XRE-family HTH domain